MNTRHYLLPTFALFLAVAPLQAEGPFRNRDNKDPNDAGEPTYPVPYQMPTVAEITETLGRVRGFLESATPTRVINRTTRKEITDFTTPVAEAVVERSEANFSLIAYEMGVVHAGMLRAAEVTGDKAFTAFTTRKITKAMIRKLKHACRNTP